MSIELADVLRKLAFGQAAVLALLTVWTIFRFAKKAVTAPSADRALPLHVVLISSSYLLLIYIVTVGPHGLSDLIGQPPTYRIPLVLIAFALGVGALAFMVAHLSARRTLREAFAHKVEAEANKEIARQIERTEYRMQRMEEVGQHTHDKVQEMQEGDITARAKAAQSLENVGQKADTAYYEANAINEKIDKSSEEVSGKLSDIKTEAETARQKASDVSDKADAIGETGKDTNIRVRNIEKEKPNANQ